MEILDQNIKMNLKLHVGELKVKKLNDNAILPSKSKIDDIGYDITLTHLIEQFSIIRGWENLYTNGYVYGTGIAITPPSGYYCDLVPRSSFAKTGYVLGNSFGVIDPNYTGELKVIVYKINPDASDLQLPGRYFQLILRPVISANIIEVNELDETERGDKGFGSTGV